MSKIGLNLRILYGQTIKNGTIMCRLAGGYTEPNVPLKTLMSEQEKYLLWRYEYILTSIYDTPYLVKPDGFVPKRSTILRDKESGRMIGVARYSGYFM